MWTVRGGPTSKECGHQDAWQKSLELEADPQMLQYAADDIYMLRLVYDHYRQEPGFSALQHDMALIPWAAAIRMLGVHVDEQARDTAIQQYKLMRDDGAAYCEVLGLHNPNSADQVVDYVNKHVISPSNVILPSEEEALDEVEDGRRKDTLEPLLAVLKQRENILNTQGKNTAKVRDAIQNLEKLIQTRVFDRKLKFLESIHGDSVFPQFHVYGTQTDRVTCTNPNTQQMPSPDRETDFERENDLHLRAMFTPPAGWKMYGGDFDQLELRIKSGVTNDPFTQTIYAKETDAYPADEHSETALNIFHTELQKVYPGLSDDQLLTLLRAKDAKVKGFRAKAKPVGFGIAYGATAYGIARAAGCSVEEAERILGQYWRLCSVTKQVIEAEQAKVTVIRGNLDGRIITAQPKEQAVFNVVGVARYFRIPQQLIYIAGKMADAQQDINGRTYLEKHFSELAESPVSVKRGRDWATGQPLELPILNAFRAALRGAAFGLQEKVHRQAFNFIIQSAGAYLTKQLQGQVYRLIPAGVWTGAEMPLLPGLQVHDEIHCFAKKPMADQVVDVFLRKATQLIRCPIRFSFSEVGSWAEK